MVMGRLIEAVRSDVAGLAAVLGGGGALAAMPRGLLTYDFRAHGGRTRLHLRLQDDGSGVLFRDVTDVIHLSDTAAEMCWMALEGFTERRAIGRLVRRYAGVRRSALAADYRQMQRVVATLSDPRQGCHTCALELPRTPLFSTRAQAPHKVDLALTYLCNNRCPHCYNDPTRFDLASLETGEWRVVLDRLAAIGVPHVIFTGGEATLHPGFPELVRHADGLGQIAGLNTNARRFAQQPGYAELLACAGLDHVQVTLHSHRSPVHDAMVAARAFEQTVAGIRAALHTDMHVITNTTITRLNADDIEQTVHFLHELGLTTFAMNGMIYSGGGDANPDAIPQEAYPPILVRIRDTAAELGMRFLWYTVTEYCEMSPVELEIGAKRCNAGEYSMCVEPNGDVLPCQSYYVSAGNMLRDDWRHIWQGELFRSFRHREEDPRGAGLPEKCWECPDLPLCGGGCRIERESREGKAPGGCQSCASGGCSKKTIRSTGISAYEAAEHLPWLKGGGCALGGD